jgi:hypothetical protein
LDDVVQSGSEQERFRRRTSAVGNTHEFAALLWHWFGCLVLKVLCGIVSHCSDDAVVFGHLVDLVCACS